MILSDIDIRKEIESGRIVIDPFDPASIQPSSVDLHVDNRFRVFANSRYPYIDVKKEMPGLTEVVEVGGAPVRTPEALVFDLDGNGLIARITVYTQHLGQEVPDLAR